MPVTLEPPTRWNPDAEPPAAAPDLTGDVAALDARVDALEAASPPSGGSWDTAIPVTAYGARPTETAAVNTAAFRACVNTAAAGGRNVAIPAGVYLVNPGCLTPPLGSRAAGLMYLGEGPWRSTLRMAPQSSPGYFHDNAGNGTTLAFPHYSDLGFEGGPTDTPEQRVAVNPNHNGFRVEGPTDQSFRFFRCRFATLNHCFHTVGSNNADVTLFLDTRFRHIAGDVLRLDNHQSVNMNFHDCSMDVIWGNVVHAIDSNGDGWGGGGAINYIGGHIIVQRHEAAVGRLVKAEHFISSTVNFMSARVEVRDDAMAVDGAANRGPFACNFVGSTVYTTATADRYPDVRLVDLRDNQAVTFTSGCTFESNGADQNWNVQGTGRLHFRDCGLRGNIQAKVTKSATSRVIARDCWQRYAQGTAIDFTLSGAQ